MSTDVLDSLVHAHLPAAARGDRDAYGRIVAACQGTVTSIALAIVRDVPASEDIAQEAFLSAWQNLRKLNNRASFLPWLRQITRNLARDHLRARARLREPGGDVEALLAEVADPQPMPCEQVADNEEHVIAAAVIGGANLAGGMGTALGAVVGAALIEVIRNSLILLGISTFWQGTFVGCFIILAVAFDRLRNQDTGE